MMRTLTAAASFCVLGATLMLNACQDGGRTATASTPAPATVESAQPANISWDIVNILPHDPSAFTEGLEYRDGFLYESTGEYGSSELRKVDPATGKVLTTVKLEPQYFGEGITIINEKLYQLTYREGKGFVYDLGTLKKTGGFSFHTAEGWGMTTNGSQLIFDEGSNVLHYLDASTFAEVKTLSVTDQDGKVDELNELEMIQGFLYANVWKQDVILKIDTTTGKVAGRIDLTSLRQRAGIPEISGRRGTPEVMNGIAADPAGDRIFITGKYWPKMIVIRLGK